ncbi:hypothetical protein FisN_8Lu039 [Fistulifera solaris]|uniref:Uncharacterized protein n=1 Tax=Fistulifera solaris TaxID=1519565 RepID=A0A1Z5JD59_FISSO|nr:hypothetical protein FisN_8Lu039 [Fistulifera solaris]|eukprot:GAX11950.1 hypothetical protein FisN_8Lu039 [Fistulifera solaris]
MTTLKLFVMYALMGFTSALFDRSLQICNRGGGGGGGGGGGDVEPTLICDCNDPVGQGYCRNENNQPYNSCLKEDTTNTITLETCKQFTEGIPQARGLGFYIDYSFDSKICEIYFDSSVTLNSQICPAGFNTRSVVNAGSGPVTTVSANQNVKCCRCELSP